MVLRSSGWFVQGSKLLRKQFRGEVKKLSRLPAWCSRCVLSDIVKRRSFRANGTVAEPEVALSPRPFRAILQSVCAVMICGCIQVGESLTAIAVGSILKQSWSF